jgi:pyrimidine 5'-nucleotidase
MKFSTLFFDLDATLYPASNGLWEQIRLRIFQYMEEVVGIKKDQIPETRDRYWKTYGTTLEGLRIHHQVEVDNYLAYVHNLPLENYLKDDPHLREHLSSLPQDLWVFTNADQVHAERVLKKLGIANLFTGIVDLIKLDLVVKPDPAAYKKALQLAGSPDPAECVHFDDLLPNLMTANKMGITTCLVGNNSQPPDYIDYQMETIHNIRNIMPELWTGSNQTL